MQIGGQMQEKNHGGGEYGESETGNAVNREIIEKE